MSDKQTTTQEPIEYEKPKIVDYGDLVDLTAGLWSTDKGDGATPTLLLRRSPRFRQLSDAAVSGVLELLVVDGSFHPGVAERHSRSTELRAPGFVSERAQGPFPPLWPTRRRLCGFPAPRSRRAISPCASRGPYALARRARCAPRPSSTSAGVHRREPHPRTRAWFAAVARDPSGGRAPAAQRARCPKP